MIENQGKLETIEKQDYQFRQKALLSGFAYLFGWISAVIVLNIPQYRKHPEIRFHAWQSVVLSSFYFLGRIMVETLHLSVIGLGTGSEFGVTNLTSHLAWFCSVLLANVSWALNLLAFLLWLAMIIRAVHEETFEVPILTPFARKLAARGGQVNK